MTAFSQAPYSLLDLNRSAECKKFVLRLYPKMYLCRLYSKWVKWKEPQTIYNLWMCMLAAFHWSSLSCTQTRRHTNVYNEFYRTINQSKLNERKAVAHNELNPEKIPYTIPSLKSPRYHHRWDRSIYTCGTYVFASLKMIMLRAMWRTLDRLKFCKKYRNVESVFGCECDVNMHTYTHTHTIRPLCLKEKCRHEKPQCLKSTMCTTSISLGFIFFAFILTWSIF